VQLLSGDVAISVSLALTWKSRAAHRTYCKVLVMKSAAAVLAENCVPNALSTSHLPGSAAYLQQKQQQQG